METEIWRLWRRSLPFGRHTMPKKVTPGLAVALGSSFLGYYAHAGFLNGLAAAGLHPERIAGASAGAIAGALHASGLRGEALKAAALDPGLRWSFFDWGAFFRLPGVLMVLWSSGVLSGKGAVKRLHRLLDGADLASFDSPGLEIAVTDAEHHRTEILREGPLAELVVASCAVPGLLRIQQVGARRYLDGGIACEAPFEQWLDDPAIEVIVVHRIRHEANSGPTVGWETVASSIGSAHQAICHELHRHRVELARGKGKRLVEIETVTPAPGMFRQRKALPCYQRGFASGQALRLAL
jgi:predicted acylesterase/phospholipase RssA